MDGNEEMPETAFGNVVIFYGEWFCPLTYFDSNPYNRGYENDEQDKRF